MKVLLLLSLLFHGLTLGSTPAQTGTGSRTGSVPKERPAIRPASALHGWADWERGKKIFEKIKVPPAPPLSPEEELATFRMAPGYRVELVASEPMVANPIFFEFDADGRIWALEYRGYMRDLQGSGEGDSICRLVVLEDTNEDGKADKSTVYLDKLVMPRSFAFVEGGVLLAEPPHLWYCRDTNGDLECDEKIKVGTYGVAGNPQHTANGLRRGMDNWLHSADWGKRHRFREGKLLIEDVIRRGQFGVSFDDLGRFFSCHESTAAVADYIPEEYLRRNPNLMSLYRRGGNRDRFGVGVHITRQAQEVFPIRPTPAVTLGGLELRDDGTLRTYTIASGTCVYRGDQFPANARGNLFVPEAGGHLIGRLVLGGGLTPTARRFYPAQQELLASTDERFRPVNARTGPDGALYIADMYKGVIEHVIFMVPWLTDQIKARKLETGNDMGRIWRIVSTEKAISRKSPALSKASVAELVKTLNHPNGWRRDTAQRLLVDRRPEEAIPLLQRLVKNGGSHLGRMHALWTLKGMSALEWNTATAALKDGHPYVRATALRVLESLLEPKREAEFLDAITELLVPRDKEIVLLQAILTLGGLKSKSEDYFQIMNEFLIACPHPLSSIAAMSSLGGRELEFLQYVYQDGKRPRTASFLADLSQLVAREGEPGRVAQLLEIGVEGPIWAKMIADSIIAVNPEKVIKLSREPAIVQSLSRSDDPTDNERAMKLRKLATWPGNTPWQAARVDLKPLTSAQVELAKLGAEKYALYCASCHQPQGSGAQGVAPPLAKSEWVNGPPERLAQIVLRGMVGPIKVRGQEWNLYMPGLGNSGVVDDKELAAILTFLRRAWGNRADAVDPDFVARERKTSTDRKFPWTAEELAGNDAPSKPASKSIQSDERGQFVLQAKAAQVLAQKLRYHPKLDLIGPWVVEGDAALWQVSAPATGSYRVHLLHAMDNKNAGNSYVIESDLSALSGKITSTGGFDKFIERDVGTLKLKKGTNRILMRPAGAPKGELIDLRSIRLVPVE